MKQIILNLTDAIGRAPSTIFEKILTQKIIDTILKKGETEMNEKTIKDFRKRLEKDIEQLESYQKIEEVKSFFRDTFHPLLCTAFNLLLIVSDNYKDYYDPNDPDIKNIMDFLSSKKITRELIKDNMETKQTHHSEYSKSEEEDEPDKCIDIMHTKEGDIIFDSLEEVEDKFYQVFPSLERNDDGLKAALVFVTLYTISIIEDNDKLEILIEEGDKKFGVATFILLIIGIICMIIFSVGWIIFIVGLILFYYKRGRYKKIKSPLIRFVRILIDSIPGPVAVFKLVIAKYTN